MSPTRVAPSFSDHQQYYGHADQLSAQSSLQHIQVYTEPLKVCLDDDSSCGSDAMMDDEYFFGGDEEFAAMANDLSSYGVDDCPTSTQPGRSGNDMDMTENMVIVSDDGLSECGTLSGPTLGSSTDISCLSVRSSTGAFMQSVSWVDLVSLRHTRLRQSVRCEFFGRMRHLFFHTVSMIQTSRLCHSASYSRFLTCSPSGKTGNLTHVSQESSSRRTNRSKRRVCLDDNVSVIPIPMRTEYSDRVKGKMWSSAAELSHNASRNYIEFAAEGWNWRTVTEDEYMWKCAESGELIHPIHLHNASFLPHPPPLAQPTANHSNTSISEDLNKTQQNMSVATSQTA